MIIYVINWLSEIFRLTLNRTGNQDHLTISLYSYQRALSWTNSLNYCHHIRWIKLFLCSLQGHMSICASTLKILSIGNFRHRNLKIYIFLRTEKDNLRIACFGILRRKTQQNFGSWFLKGVACWITEIKSHVRLPG